MRILVASHSYAPHPSPRSYRWFTIVRHWIKQGHNIDVVCAHYPGSSRIENRKGSVVHRVGGTIFEAIRGGLKGYSCKVNVGATARCEGKSSPGTSSRVMRWFHDNTWKRVYWPDYACLWYYAGVKACEARLRQSRYDALISVSLPFTSHLVGLRIKRLNPKMRWLADCGDPLSFMDLTPANNLRLHSQRNRRYESVVFKMADAVAVTTDGTAARYAELFPKCRSKIHVIPPLLSLPVSITRPRFSRQNGVLKLAYLGTLYKEIRNPGPLLRLLSQLRLMSHQFNLNLHFYGLLHDTRECFEPFSHLMDKCVFIHGPVSREEAARAILEADVLVNIGNTTTYQLPSKVVEYAAAAKPILNICSNLKDSSAELLSTYPAALSLVSVPGEWSDLDLERAAKFLANPNYVTEADLHAWLSPYQIESVAGAYERLLFQGV